MKIIGHHTCDAKGEITDVELIEKQGPFLSFHNEDNPDSHKRLGTGYYFFDNNIIAAHTHGKNRYKRKYYIFEAELFFKEDNLLDLVGNRIHMLWFQEIMRRFTPYLEGKKWKLGSFIEFLKKIQQTKEFRGLFPYKAVRIVDSSVQIDKIKEEYKLYFIEGKDNFLNIQPIFIICLLEIDWSIIKSFKHRYSNV